MLTVTLPQLVAGRDLADAVVNKLGILTGEQVRVDATELVVGAPSFAAQLVERVLADGAAKSLTVEGAPANFVTYLQAAADKLDLADRLIVERTPALI